MTAQVLVVDDSPEFGRRAAELITLKAGLATEFVSDADAACALVERERVAVVVLDERMPEVPGTELFQRLLAVRPDLRAIMLTGEADAAEVGRALSLGYKDYLSKSRIADLPQRAAMQYLDFMVAEATAGNDGDRNGTLVWPRNLLTRVLRGVEVRRAATMVLDERVVGEWVTVLELNAGEERRFSYGRTDTRTVQIERESQIALKSALKVKSTTLATILESATESSAATKDRHSTTVVRGATQSTERVLSLPAQADSDFVRVRHFQEAPVRRKLLVTLVIGCERCRVRSTVPVVVLETTGQVATRHQDYLNDNSVRTVETGTVDLRFRGEV
ncbi:response regulator [Actinoplanes sp. LDG1-06]|uniref:Response regulator n=1 Tax=Paractinoplanes ovalisporus TaxID=2810368 RepID=A0ABS2A598_9ACTN|nr:response regulator [Actinoplanes ovalisporus]MBM2614972.1 response regulator [Actinoplanes ovalisporus]